MDIILLGLGPEGHLASLFPQQPVLDSQDLVDHPHIPSMGWRYTLTFPVLDHARALAFWVVGAEKAGIVRRISQLKEPTPDVPASLIHPLTPIQWFVDHASGASLPC